MIHFFFINYRFKLLFPENDWSVNCCHISCVSELTQLNIWFRVVLFLSHNLTQKNDSFMTWMVLSFQWNLSFVLAHKKFISDDLEYSAQVVFDILLWFWILFKAFRTYLLQLHEKELSCFSLPCCILEKKTKDMR